MFPLFRLAYIYIQWNLTSKTTHGTAQNGLNIEVVSIMNFADSAFLLIVHKSVMQIYIDLK